MNHKPVPWAPTLAIVVREAFQKLHILGVRFEHKRTGRWLARTTDALLHPDYHSWPPIRYVVRVKFDLARSNTRIRWRNLLERFRARKHQ